MNFLELTKLEKYLAICITLMVCTTRLSMAAGTVFYVLSILLGLAMWYKQKTVNITKSSMLYVLAYLVFLVSLLPSVLFSGALVKSFGEFVNVFCYRAVVFALMLCFIKKREYIINMLLTFMGVTCIDCLVAGYQLAIHFGTGAFRGVRGWGFGSNVLTLAGIMTMLMPMVLVFIYDSSIEQKLKNAAKALLGCLLIGLWSNKSRSTWLFIPITLMPIFWQYIRKNSKQLMVVLLVVVLAGGAVMVNPIYRNRLLSIGNVTTDRSNADRLEAWKSSVEMFKDHPVTGVGIGQWRKEYREKYKSDKDTQGLVHAHNNELQLAAEAGTIGLLGFLYFCLSAIVESFKAWRKDENPYDLIIFSIFLGYIVLFGQIEYVLDNSSGMRIMWFLVASLLLIKESERSKSSDGKGQGN